MSRRHSALSADDNFTVHNQKLDDGRRFCLRFVPDTLLTKMRIARMMKVVPHMDLPFHDEVTGCLLFLDVSGFTKMTEEFAKQETDQQVGVTKLVKTLHHYIKGIAKMILSFDGDIINYAGDAILACWPCEYPQNLGREVAKQAVMCALAIRHQYDEKHVEEVNMVLRTKMSIAMGSFKFLMLGDQKCVYRNYVALGKPVKRVNTGEHLCNPGDIVVDESVTAYLDIVDYFTGDVAGSNKHFRITGCVPNMQITYTHVRTTEYDTDDQWSVTSSGDDQKREREDETVVNSAFGRQNLRMRDNLGADMRCFEEDEIRAFMMRPVWIQITGRQPVELLNTISETTIIFLNVVTDNSRDQEVDDPNLEAQVVSDVYNLIMPTINALGGALNKVTTFDKGITFLLLFGLQGSRLKNELLHALQCSAIMLMQCRTVSNVKTVSVGITRGRCFNGCFGPSDRMEFTVLGRVVNTAARIMCYYPDCVACEKSVMLASGLPTECFTEFTEHKPLKGIADEVIVYKYNPDVTPDLSIREYAQKPLAYRKIQMDIRAKVQQSLRHHPPFSVRRLFFIMKQTCMRNNSTKKSTNAPEERIITCGSLLQMLEQHAHLLPDPKNKDHPLLHLPRLHFEGADAAQTGVSIGRNFIVIQGRADTGKSRILDGVRHELMKLRSSNDSIRCNVIAYKTPVLYLQCPYFSAKAILALCLQLKPYDPPSLLFQEMLQRSEQLSKLLRKTVDLLKDELIHFLGITAVVEKERKSSRECNVSGNQPSTIPQDENLFSVDGQNLACRVIYIFLIYYVMSSEQIMVFLIDDAQYMDCHSFRFLHMLCTHNNSFVILTVPDCKLYLEHLRLKLGKNDSMIRMFEQQICASNYSSSYLFSLGSLVRSKIGELICVALGVTQIPDELERYIFELCDGVPGRLRRVLSDLLQKNFIGIVKMDDAEETTHSTRLKLVASGRQTSYAITCNSVTSYSDYPEDLFFQYATLRQNRLDSDKRTLSLSQTSAIQDDEILFEAQHLRTQFRSGESLSCVLKTTAQKLQEYEPPTLLNDTLAHLESLPVNWLTVLRFAAAVGTAFHYHTLERCLKDTLLNSADLDEAIRSLISTKFFACVSCTVPSDVCVCKREQQSLAFTCNFTRKIIDQNIFDNTKDWIHECVVSHLLTLVRERYSCVICNSYVIPFWSAFATQIPQPTTLQDKTMTASPECQCFTNLERDHVYEELIIHCILNKHRFHEALYYLSEYLSFAIKFGKKSFASRLVIDISLVTRWIAMEEDSTWGDISRLFVYDHISEALRVRKSLEEKTESDTSEQEQETEVHISEDDCKRADQEGPSTEHLACLYARLQLEPVTVYPKEATTSTKRTNDNRPYELNCQNNGPYELNFILLPNQLKKCIDKSWSEEKLKELLCGLYCALSGYVLHFFLDAPSTALERAIEIAGTKLPRTVGKWHCAVQRIKLTYHSLRMYYSTLQQQSNEVKQTSRPENLTRLKLHALVCLMMLHLRKENSHMVKYLSLVIAELNLPKEFDNAIEAISAISSDGIERMRYVARTMAEQQFEWCNDNKNEEWTFT